MKHRLLPIIVIAIASFVPDSVFAQTPTPSPRTRTQRPSASPTVSYKPAASPSVSKPSTSSTNSNTSLAKLPIISSQNTSKAADLRRAGTKPKPLAAAQKQQVLGGQAASTPIVVDTNHLNAEGEGVKAELLFAKSGVWEVNASVSTAVQGGAVLIWLTSKTEGQMYLVDISLDGESKGVTGFTLNDQPFSGGIVGGSDHLLFFVRGDAKGVVTSKIAADHEWLFYSCQISAVK